MLNLVLLASSILFALTNALTCPRSYIFSQYRYSALPYGTSNLQPADQIVYTNFNKHCSESQAYGMSYNERYLIYGSVPVTSEASSPFVDTNGMILSNYQTISCFLTLTAPIGYKLAVDFSDPNNCQTWPSGSSLAVYNSSAMGGTLFTISMQYDPVSQTYKTPFCTPKKIVTPSNSIAIIVTRYSTLSTSSDLFNFTLSIATTKGLDPSQHCENHHGGGLKNLALLLLIVPILILILMIKCWCFRPSDRPALWCFCFGPPLSCCRPAYGGSVGPVIYRRQEPTNQHVPVPKAPSPLPPPPPYPLLQSPPPYSPIVEIGFKADLIAAAARNKNRMATSANSKKNPSPAGTTTETNAALEPPALYITPADDEDPKQLRAIIN